MEVTKLKGGAQDIGKRHGAIFAEHIRRNLSILVWREGYEPLPRQDPAFQRWVDDQEEILAANWPWLLDEMRGVAQGAGLEYRDILWLNLRVWQYHFYSGQPASPAAACSSLIVALADGSVASAGALDDGCEYYCGLVEVAPAQGHSYMSFPIAGTSWGNRGVNSAGLCVGSSSQILPGLKRLPGSFSSDLANRLILQTCATVAEVRDFCQRHPFTLNLACSDKNGDAFCAHQTSAGLFEVASQAPCAITNHVVDDRLIYKLHELGVGEFCESPTSRLRRGRLLDFARANHGKTSAEALRRFIADRMAGAPSSTCPKHNVALTYANPQTEPGKVWTATPQASGDETWTRHEI